MDDISGDAKDTIVSEDRVASFDRELCFLVAMERDVRCKHEKWQLDG